MIICIIFVRFFVGFFWKVCIFIVYFFIFFDIIKMLLLRKVSCILFGKRLFIFFNCKVIVVIFFYLFMKSYIFYLLLYLFCIFIKEIRNFFKKYLNVKCIFIYFLRFVVLVIIFCLDFSVVRFLYVVLLVDVGLFVVMLVNGLVFVIIIGFFGGKIFLVK